MDILIQAFQLILSLSILVVFHEMGHFVAARVFKTRVEKFYLFFDPWFSIFKFKYKDTEYGMGWLPLGGYVKISGMIDESMDKEQMQKPAEPYEFRAKPAWQRLIIMLGGVTVNLILGFLIYSMILFAYGEKYIPNENLTDGIWAVSDVAGELGLETGDKVLSIDGEEIRRVNDIMPKMFIGETVEIDRGGQIINVEMPIDFADKLINAKKQTIIWPRIPFTVSVVGDSTLNTGIILPLDKIIALNNQEIKYYDQYKAIGQTFSNSNAKLKVIRENEEIVLDVKIDSLGKIGVMPAMYQMKDLEKAGVYTFADFKYGFWESFPAGWSMAMDKLDFYVKQIPMIFNPKTGAYKGVGGFGAIGSLFPSYWSWKAFWEITAFLSLILAFMNVLPIPALDGGHVLFLLYEIITGKAPSDKFLEYAQVVGMILLLGLLVFANGNDILKLFTN